MRRRRGSQPLRLAQALKPIQLFDQLLFGEGDHNRPLLPKAFRRRQLMVVAVLSEAGQARHHDEPLAKLKRGDDRPHSRMGDDKARRFDVLTKFRRVEKPLRADVSRAIVRLARLRKNIGLAAGACPFIDRADEAIKLTLGPDRRKNHSTDPT